MEERGTVARRRSPLTRGLGAVLVPVLALAGAVALGACGGDDDATEPEGTFEAEISTPSFPINQRLAETVHLRIGVQNTGTETIPQLAFTITTEEQGAEDAALADGPFSIRLTGDEADEVSDPNRSVWQLAEGFPMFGEQFQNLRELEQLPEDEEPPTFPIDEQPPQTSPGLVAQTNTFGFGALEPGESRRVIWRLTPTRAGRYILNYEVTAGLEGRAQLVSTGGAASGSFTVTITDVPRRARVDRDGGVFFEDDDDANGDDPTGDAADEDEGEPRGGPRQADE